MTGLAGARRVAGLLIGLLLVQGLGLASLDDGVMVTTDKLSYELGETSVVRVSNRLDTMITTRDQRFECSIIALEHRRDGDGYLRYGGRADRRLRLLHLHEEGRADRQDLLMPGRLRRRYGHSSRFGRLRRFHRVDRRGQGRKRKLDLGLLRVAGGEPRAVSPSGPCGEGSGLSRRRKAN